MEDFNNYAKNFSGKTKNGGASGTNGAGGLFETVTRLAKKFDGKNQNDLLRAIYSEAEKGKRAGTLSNADIDNFVA